MKLSMLTALTLATSLALGCANTATEESEATVGAEDALTASSLVGEYVGGARQFQSIKLERVTSGGTVSNVFEAVQLAMCHHPPTCASRTISGKWFARGDTLQLTATGEGRLTYKFKLSANRLSLRDDDGDELVSLRRIAPQAPAVAALVASRGLTKMRVDLSAAEATRQASRFSSDVSFEDALAAALDSFLNDDSDGESPLSLVADLDEDDACKRATAKASLKCYLNSPDAELGMLKVGESAEHGETVSKNWIFTVSLPNLSDHGHWAVVDRSGEADTYNYGFN